MGIAVGVATHVLFAYTVVRLYQFLADTSTVDRPGPLWTNAVWATLYGVVHSTLLLPSVRRRLEPWLGRPFYGCFYCVVTCGCLLWMFDHWHSDARPIWHASGAIATAIRAAFIGTWGLLLYSLSLMGLGYQTGWTPWWNWLRHRSQPPRQFTPRGAYHLFRHPVYLSFLGLVWVTPTMTADRAVLTAVWTVYVYLGSWLKDRRLDHYLGTEYRAYAARVPGYPGMTFGPLSRWRHPTDSLASVPAASTTSPATP